MANKLYEEESIQAIADAIRTNAPNSTGGNTYTVEEMPQGVGDVYSEGYNDGLAAGGSSGSTLPVIKTNLAVWNTIDELRIVLRNNGVTENDMCIADIAGSNVICQIKEINFNGTIHITYWQEPGFPYYETGSFYSDTILGVPPSTTIDEIRQKVQNQLKTDAKTITGAINELHDEIEEVKENGTGGSSGGALEMPIIRFIGLRGENLLSEVSGAESSVQFTVEIIAGSVQVGDTLQICGMRTFCASAKNPAKKRKLRRFAEYVIAEEDLDKRFLTLTVPPTKNAFAHLGHNNRQSGGPAIFYFRIRRPIGDLQTNDSGMTVDAKFSNVVPVSMMYASLEYEGDDGTTYNQLVINVI